MTSTTRRLSPARVASAVPVRSESHDALGGALTGTTIPWGCLGFGLLTGIDPHTSRPAVVGVAQVEGEVHLWLSEREASSASLGGWGQLPAHRSDAVGGARTFGVLLAGATGSGPPLCWTRTRSGPRAPAASRLRAVGG